MAEDPRRLVRQFLYRKKWAYSLSIMAIVAAELVMVQFPHLLGEFTDTLSAGKLTYSGIVYYSLALLAVGVGYVVFYGIGQFHNGQIGREFEYELRKRLFTHWEELSTAYFRYRSVGDLLNHAMNDVQTVRDALSGGMNILTNAIFLLASTLYMTFRTISVKLTLVSIIPILFVPLFVVWWGPRIRAASRKVQEALSSMSGLTEESLGAIRLVKATANEAIEKGRFEERVDHIVQEQMTVFRLSALFQSLIPLMGSLSFVIALFYGGYMTLSKALPLGAFVAFTLYLAMIITPLQQIGFVINNFQRASASLGRLRVLLCERPEITDPVSPDSVSEIHGDIRFDLAAFQYADANHPALSDIRFEVKQGQTVGIVGRTASGKTTLVSLLPRMFDPPAASVFVDGHDVRDLRLKVLRESIAYVPQDGFLFSTTIAENIGFANAAAKSDDIHEAARLADIDTDIQQFARQYETVVGERGITLSGGQRQRTALARALLKDAPILVLDDSLSAVDMNTEKQILHNLGLIRRNKTTLIIAHRLSAVRYADSIVVLDNGRIAEQGTHEALLRQNGIYAAMYALQDEGGGVTG